MLEVWSSTEHALSVQHARLQYLDLQTSRGLLLHHLSTPALSVLKVGVFRHSPFPSKCHSLSDRCALDSLPYISCQSDDAKEMSSERYVIKYFFYFKAET